MVKRKLSELQEAEYNPNEMNSRELTFLQNSIKKFGYIAPIIVNKRTGRIVGGHQRKKVLEQLGYDEIDVIEIDVPEEVEKQLNIALNNIKGHFNEFKLGELLEEISKNDSFDSWAVGFTPAELDKLLKELNTELDELLQDDNSQNEDTEERKTKHVCPKCGFEWYE